MAGRDTQANALRDDSVPLIPDASTRARLGSAAMAQVDRWIDMRARLPSFVDRREGLLDEIARPPAETGTPMDTLLRSVEEAGLAGWDKTDGGDLAYIPNGALYSGVLGVLLASGSHGFTGQAGEAPALVAMEEGVIRWMADLIGLPAEAGGILLSGGSLANQTAIVTARARLGPDPSGGTMYVSERVHHSVVKAARLAGVPEARIRVVAADTAFRMDVEALLAAIRADRERGLRPFLVVGVAGSTDTGSVDPLAAIASVASEAGAWFHVDAAYGGFFALTARGRVRFDGIQRADSVTLDAHKGLFLPYGLGALLVRDRSSLVQAHAGHGAYLRDVAATGALPHYFQLGPELTRPARGLAIWLPLHLHGVAAFRAALDEMLDLAGLAADRLGGIDGLHVLSEPALSVVVFRATAGDDATDRILAAINASGRFHVASTALAGKACIRLAFLNPATTRAHVENVTDLIAESAAAG